MPKRIVHMLNSMGMGGIENFIMNLYRSINREEYQFDFILQSKEEGYFEKEIKELGGNIYKIPRIEKQPLKHLTELRKILKSNEYIAFHRHTDNSVNFMDLAIAQSVNIKNVIVHSHTTSHSKEALNKICRPLLYSFADEHLACGQAAGEWLFGNKKFKIIKNGMQLEKYEYSEEKRNLCREKFGFSSTDIVIGHVGRFSDVKNQKFLIEVFEKISKLNEQYKLIFCGDGELRGELSLYCKENGLDGKVIFLGVRRDINEILQAMDLFAFPSKYEGLGIALIEAQLTSLPCLISKNIPKEALYNNNILQLGIEESDKEEWCKQIVAFPITTAYRSYKNEKLYNEYDVRNIARELCEIYEGE